MELLQNERVILKKASLFKSLWWPQPHFRSWAPMPERHREVKDLGSLNPQTKHAWSKCSNPAGLWQVTSLEVTRKVTSGAPMQLSGKVHVYIMYTDMTEIWRLDMPLLPPLHPRCGHRLVIWKHIEVCHHSMRGDGVSLIGEKMEHFPKGMEGEESRGVEWCAEPHTCWGVIRVLSWHCQFPLWVFLTKENLDQVKVSIYCGRHSWPFLLWTLRGQSKDLGRATQYFWCGTRIQKVLLDAVWNTALVCLDNS